MTEKNSHPEDQIGFSGLRALLYDLLHAFFSTGSFIGYVIRKNRFLITLCFVFGMVIGYAYYALKPSRFEVSMIVQFNVLTKKTYSEIVGQLGNLIASGPEERLARELQLSENTAAKLLYVETRDMNDNPLANDTSTRVNQPFKIVAGLHDNFDFAEDSLQTGILNYINSSPYLKKLKQEDHVIFTAKLAAIDNDIAKLDSLKTEYNHFLAFSKVSATFYNSAVNPADFYLQSANLQFQREVVLRQLTLEAEALSVIDGFKIIHSRKLISVPRIILLFGGTLALLAFLIAFVRETKKRVMISASSLISGK